MYSSVLRSMNAILFFYFFNSCYYDTQIADHPRQREREHDNHRPLQVIVLDAKDEIPFPQRLTHDGDMHQIDAERQSRRSCLTTAA